MKKTIYYLFLSCILIAGCSDQTILEGPPVIMSIALNTDSIHTQLGGKYKVYLKAGKGSHPVFYSDRLYNSGEVLTTTSYLESMENGKVAILRDTIVAKDKQMEKLSEENDLLRQELKEKNLLIRFMTGK